MNGAGEGAVGRGVGSNGGVGRRSRVLASGVGGGGLSNLGGLGGLDGLGVGQDGAGGDSDDVRACIGVVGLGQSTVLTVVVS